MNNPKLIDSHAHLQFAAFDKDREEVLKRMLSENIWAINIGTNLETSKKAIELAKNNLGLFASVGLHPSHLEELNDPNEISSKEPEEFNEENYIPFLSEEKVVGIGECGLEYFHLENEIQKTKQKEVFKRQINLAKEFNKPLILHIRSKKNNDAHYDALKIISNSGFNVGVAHFFTADWNIAKEFLQLGFYLAFPGVITFTEQYDEVVKNTPMNRILIETDCPYASPEPHRGKRNEPIFVKYVAEKIANIKGVNFEKVAKITTENAIMLFQLKN